VKSLQSGANERWGGNMKSVKAPSEKLWKQREPLIDDGVQPIETFVEFESPTNFKGFEALHNIVLNIDDQLLCSNFQMESWTYV
jgi:hypothetical protein